MRWHGGDWWHLKVLCKRMAEGDLWVLELRVLSSPLFQTLSNQG